MTLLFAAACSSRGCATCVGYTPEAKLASIENATLRIEQELQSSSYGPVLASLAISDPNEVCKAMPAATKLSWNSITTQPTKIGGGQNMWCGRGDAYTLCGAVEGTVPASVLLGAASNPSGGDRFEVDDGAGGKLGINVAAGRPRVDVLSAESKEIAIVFDGLAGAITDVSPCAVLEKNAATEGCTPLTKIATTGNRVRLRFEPKSRTAGTWQMQGTVRLEPTATCTPAKKTCKASVSYPLRVAFVVP
jgi:hypothetical protein